MDSQEAQIENYLSQISTKLNRENEKRGNEKCMLSLIELLVKELEISRKNEKDTADNLNKLVRIETFSLNEKYVKEKEHHDDLKQKYENINIELSQTKTEFNAEIELLKDSIERTKVDHNNQLQMLIASNDMAIDERESTYKRQLVDANNKIRYLQNTNRELQIEINRLKQNDDPMKKLSQSNVLNFQSKSTTILNNNPINSNSYEDEDFALLERLKKSTNLNINYDKTASMTKQAGLNELEEMDKNDVSQSSTIKLFDTSRFSSGYKNKPTVYRGGRQNNFSRVPPLKPCSTSNTLEKSVKRKRKLFNPEDIDYLDSFEQDN